MEAARYWLPRSLGLLSFLWFAVMAAPTLYWHGSAELAAAGVGMGVPAPTGEPLYMMLLKAASLVPIGELAFRANILSALCGAIAVGGGARLVLVLGREDWGTIAGAAGAAGVMCGSLHFARHATVAEVHAPTAALIVITVLLFERVASGGNARVGLSLAWVAGLGFALHPEYRLLMGLPIFALLCLRAYRGARWPLLAPSMTIFAALASHLYLPVRVATGRITAIDWGHASTLSTAWAHASGEHLRGAFETTSSPSGRDVVGNTTRLLGQMLDHLGVIAVLGGAVGAVALLFEKRTRWVGVALGGVLLLDGVYAVSLHPIGLGELGSGVPMEVALCTLAGVAIALLARTSGRAAPFVGASVAILMVLAPVLFSAPGLNVYGELPRNVSEHALAKSPAGAVLITQRESLSGGTTFLQVVEGARPDVATVAVARPNESDRVAHALQSTTRGEEPLEGEGLAAVVAQWTNGRPALWELGPVAPPTGAVLVPGIVVGRLHLVGEKRDTVGSLLTDVRGLYSGRSAQDPAARRVLASSLSYAGIAAKHAGEMELARTLFRAAIDLDPGHGLAMQQLNELVDAATAAPSTIAPGP